MALASNFLKSSDLQYVRAAKREHALLLIHW